MATMDTAITGLLVAQRGLSVVSHNIANVNTPGYSRQQIEVSARGSDFRGDGFVGSGVEVTTVSRVSDAFLTEQVRAGLSADREINSFLELARRVDNMLGNDQTGLGSSLQNFFSAMQDVVNLPASTTSRQILLSEGKSLAARFQFIDSRLADLGNEIRISLSQEMRDVNTITQAIADLNDKIVKAKGQGPNHTPNDLLDQRDKLIEDLARIVSVSTVEQFDGAMNVFVGNGQPLVLGNDASKVAINETYKGHYDIIITSAFASTAVTDNITGGSLGGLLNFQSQMLDPVRNSIGRLALGFANTFNDQHRLGLTLTGEVDVPFFDVGVPEISAIGAAPNTVTAAITDPTQLTNSNYRLEYAGGNNYALTRLSDGQITNINTGGTSPFTSTSIDGFALTITAGAAVGDQYIVQPAINGASGLNVAITDANRIAAAAPLRGRVAVNGNGVPSNTGDGVIGTVAVTGSAGLPLAATVTLTFDAALNQFNVSLPPGGTLAYDPAIDSAGKQFSFASLGNAAFTISGTPADGDQFMIENNTNADGDNNNALALAGLQSLQVLLNGTASFQETYGQMVAEVGTQTRQSEISAEALGALLSQSVQARDSVSGVNLEEEAANMLKFQQAFQAAAQMISTADRIFQSLLNSIG